MSNMILYLVIFYYILIIIITVILSLIDYLTKVPLDLYLNTIEDKTSNYHVLKTVICGKKKR